MSYLSADENQINNVERKTRDQTDSHQRKLEQLYRFTASKFDAITKLRSTLPVWSLLSHVQITVLNSVSFIMGRVPHLTFLIASEPAYQLEDFAKQVRDKRRNTSFALHLAKNFYWDNFWTFTNTNRNFQNTLCTSQ